MAPDKIYVFPHGDPESPLAGFAWKDTFHEEEADVYIRKDALLEWAKETKEELEKQNVIKDVIRNGAIWELEEVIMKIQSL